MFLLKKETYSKLHLKPVIHLPIKNGTKKRHVQASVLCFYHTTIRSFLRCRNEVCSQSDTNNINYSVITSQSCCTMSYEAPFILFIPCKQVCLPIMCGSFESEVCVSGSRSTPIYGVNHRTIITVTGLHFY